MSYIFEALKRLEQKRQRVGVSRLLMVTGEGAPKRKRRPFWPFTVLALLLLLNAGVMIWWVRPRVPEKQPTSTQPPPVHEGPSATPAAGPPRANDQDRSGDMKGVRELKIASRPATPIAEKEASDISRTKHAPATRPTKPEPQARSESQAVADGRVLVLDLKQLPPTIKSSLPELKLSAHYYTVERESRFTRINGQTLREGQVLTPGVKLEEITPDGVVFSYQGYRFQMGINESR